MGGVGAGNSVTGSNAGTTAGGGNGNDHGHLVDIAQAQYKTQVDMKKKHQMVGGHNPYNTNASTSMLGEGMMTYENSIV